MNGKLLLSLGVAVTCAVVGVVSLGGSAVANVPFSEVSKRAAAERLEVYGSLDRSSIRPLKGATLVQFDLVEDKTGKRLAVLYDNPASGLPANFPAASHARAAGVFDAARGQLVSDRVLTKCPSKYDEAKKLDLATESALQRWQKSIGRAAPAEGS